MFDDLKKDNQGGAAGQNAADQAPANTSSSSPPDSPPVEPAAAGPAKMDDMFSDVDPIADKTSAVQSGKIKPVSQTNLPPNQVEPIVAPTAMLKDDMVPASPGHSGGSGIKKILFIVIGVILAGAIAYAAYIFLFNRDQSAEINLDNVNISNNDFIVNEIIEEEVVEPPLTNEELDDDADGLSNAQEAALGTNPLLADTDNDGLFDQDEVENYNTNPLVNDTDNDDLLDYDEVLIWNTDPNKIDTDGDGFSDGTEVANDYNPLGPGTIDEWSPPPPGGLVE